MKPIKTDKTNSILKAPKGSNDVDDLPITRLQFPDQTHAVESCWNLSKEEIKMIQKTRRIYFLAVGDTHPPILLSTKSQLDN